MTEINAHGQTITADPEPDLRPFAEGDILYSTWGYDQTNCDFYRVVRATASSAWIEQIGARRVAGDGWAGRVVPCPDRAAYPDRPPAPPRMYRQRPGYRGEYGLRLTSYSYASRYDRGERGIHVSSGG